jgi:hypothetical protein
MKNFYYVNCDSGVCKISGEKLMTNTRSSWKEISKAEYLLFNKVIDYYFPIRLRILADNFLSKS